MLVHRYELLCQVGDPSSDQLEAEASGGQRGHHINRSVSVVRMRNETSQSPFRLRLGDTPGAASRKISQIGAPTPMGRQPPDPAQLSPQCATRG